MVDGNIKCLLIYYRRKLNYIIYVILYVTLEITVLHVNLSCTD